MRIRKTKSHHSELYRHPRSSLTVIGMLGWSSSTRLNTVGGPVFSRNHYGAGRQLGRGAEGRGARSAAWDPPTNGTAPLPTVFARFSTRQRNWPAALGRMAGFVGYCESMHERRARDAIADRGARWYNAVAHHLRSFIRKWRRRVYIHRFLRLIDQWHRQYALRIWHMATKRRSLAQKTIARVLDLWRFGHKRLAFQKWHLSTNRGLALQHLIDVVRRAKLGIAMVYWQQIHRDARWRHYLLLRTLRHWRDIARSQRTARDMLQRMLSSCRARTTGSAFAKWYGVYLLLKEEYDKRQQWYGTSLDRMVSRQHLRLAMRQWTAFTLASANVERKLKIMCGHLKRVMLKSSWNVWRRAIFEFKRKRRNACDCAKALSKSKKGIGWCYKCSSMTHLQNRIEDSVELVEGMAFRIAKTVLKTCDTNRLRGGGSGGQNRSRRRRVAKKSRAHAGEAALDRLMGILKVEREEYFVQGDSAKAQLRSVTGQIGVDAHVEDDDGEELGATAHLGFSSTKNGDSIELDLERSIGLRPLSVGQRSFVSQSARDSFDRMAREADSQTNQKAVTGATSANRGLSAEMDGLVSSSINRWE